LLDEAFHGSGDVFDRHVGIYAVLIALEQTTEPTTRIYLAKLFRNNPRGLAPFTRLLEIASKQIDNALVQQQISTGICLAK
jgi:hypothetical protein